MAETPTLEQVLADARSEARGLQRHPLSKPTGDAILDLCDLVARAAEDWLRWLSEGEAALRSGNEARYWRARFDTLAAQGHAELRGRVRYYRQCVIPQRADLEAARAQARAREA